ncbi:MAG TPA: hypothetical protein VHV30_12125 [Polyangiaceae bacterium]|nr:hypothetical protein [Polyangiaceae bacterium]
MLASRSARASGLALVAALGIAIAPGCSLAEGSGSAVGVLDVPECWSGDFDLKPTFFAAVPPTADTMGQGSGASYVGSDPLEIRIQNGGDFESFSDGLVIVVDDLGEVRGDPLPDGTSRPSLLDTNLVVSMPVSASSTGPPTTPDPNPGIVHATLYLQRTCRTQNVALFAMSAVTVNGDGTCNPEDGGLPPLECGSAGTLPNTDGGAVQPAVDAGAGTAASPTRSSWINFQSLFDGVVDEPDAQKRLTQATFDFYLANPLEVCPGPNAPPPRCRGELHGNFKFYFERGQPAQPFP